MSELMNCPDCHGKGEIKKICPYCDGTGFMNCSVCDGTGRFWNEYGGRYNEGGDETCNVCNGDRGTPCDCENGRWTNPCDTCAGTGYLPKEQVVQIVQQRQAAARQAQEAAKLEAERLRLQRTDDEKRREAEFASQKALREASLAESARLEAEGRKAEERVRAEEARKEEARKEEQRHRTAEKRCLMCGLPLGLFDRLSQATTHSKCSTYFGPGQ